MKKLKKVISLVMLSVVLVGATGATASAQEKTEAVVEIDDGISVAKVDSTGTIALGTGETFSKSFTMKGIFGLGTEHNAFNVKISNILLGRCTVTITGSNGYSWTSSTISSDTTITTINANADTTYTVSIKGDNTYGCYATYTITSYIQ